MKDYDFNPIFYKVLHLVKKGMKINRACSSVGIDRGLFYANLNEEQKKELKFHKSTTLIFTCGSRKEGGFINFDYDNEEGIL